MKLLCMILLCAVSAFAQDFAEVRDNSSVGFTTMGLPSTSSAIVPPSSPVHWWKMYDGTVAGVYSNQYSTNSLRQSNASFQPTNSSVAAWFDGSNDKVERSIPNQRNGSVAMWVNWQLDATASEVVLGMQNAGTTRTRVGTDTTTNLLLRCATAIKSLPYPTINTWHYIAMSRKGAADTGGTVDICYDGTFYQVTGANVFGGPITVGGDPAIAWYGKAGIRDVLVWTNAITTNQMATWRTQSTPP